MNILDKSRGLLPPAEHIQAEPEPRRAIIRDYLLALAPILGAAALIAALIGGWP